MTITLNPPLIILILGLFIIFVCRHELKTLVGRIINIKYKGLDIILGQYEPKKENIQSKNQDPFFETIYKKVTGAQIHFLELVKQHQINGNTRGLECGMASQYFQNLVKVRTSRYDGWITPFLTSYLEKNGLVTVSNNYFHLEPIGMDFLNYLESTGYSEKDKEL